jgi:hypothetical protein
MANSTRSQIDDALLALLSSTTWGTPKQQFKYTSKHFQQWEGFDASNQPALFLRRITEDVIQQRAYALNKYTMLYEVWVYLRVESNDTSFDPYSAIDPVIDALDATLAANNVTQRQTLGGLVDNTRIAGQIIIADGAEDGQAVIRVPVQVFTGI